MQEGLAELLLDRCPDLLVLLDGELKVVSSSAGLRHEVPLAAPGHEFLRSLTPESEARLRESLDLDREASTVLPVELSHRGRDRLVSCLWRFYPLHPPFLAGIGREVQASDLSGQIEVLRRRYQESVNQLASLTGRLRELAMTDSLTGVFNRRAFLDHAGGEWVRHQRHGHPLACAMLDVDGFKRINDTYGHAAGDAVLQQLGALLRATLRGSDLPARLGGDEFVALMPETNLEGSAVMAERLLVRVEGQPIQATGREIRVTVSIGIASSDGCAGLEEMLVAADRALYQAKKDGRARVFPKIAVPVAGTS